MSEYDLPLFRAGTHTSAPEPSELRTMDPAPSVPTATSEEAAASIEHVAGKLRYRVLALIARGRDGIRSAGMTCDELIVATGIEANTMHPRLWELERLTFIKRDEEIRRPTRRRRMANAYTVTDLGLIALTNADTWRERARRSRAEHPAPPRMARPETGASDAAPASFPVLPPLQHEMRDADDVGPIARDRHLLDRLDAWAEDHAAASPYHAADCREVVRWVGDVVRATAAAACGKLHLTDIQLWCEECQEFRRVKALDGHLYCSHSGRRDGEPLHVFATFIAGR